MSLIFDGPVTPDDATFFVRQVPTPSDHLLAKFVPDRLVQEQTIRLANATRVNRTASFRAFDGNIPQLERDFVSTREVDLLPMSVQGSKGELERLMLEKARQDGGNSAAIIQAIYDDLEAGVRAIRNRVEVARGELLSTGKITLDENGIQLTADYQVPEHHFVAPAVPWTSVAEATIVTDLTGWVELYIADVGAPPSGMIISRRTGGLIQRNAEFKAYSHSIAGTPQIVSRSIVNSVLDDFNLPPISAVYDTVINVGGVDRRVIPEDRVIFLPPSGSPFAHVAWGITATALELVSAAQTDMAFADAPGLVGVVVKSGPPYKETTVVDSLLLPVLERPEALMVADAY
ncbi:major capsid protein [Nocardia puris]|uniref:Major capsid protein E n=1 Tax=Nocardia puris TaxID=208602 RepID=A0A366DFE5_9NOCA|nr:major capsid protein [Nocardia puris]RBO87968.1 major capsid protein E [Nocardia puris]